MIVKGVWNKMSKSILVIGTLDTKGDQVEYIKRAIEGRGQKVVLLDIGVLGQAMCKPDITNRQVAHAAGVTPEELVALKDEAKAMNKMAEGASKIVNELFINNGFDGILAMGGSMGTDCALKIMKDLPLDLPKVLLSTLSYSHAIDPDLAANGIIMIQWAGGLWGINERVKKVLKQSAAVISAAADVCEKPVADKRRKSICITALGGSSSPFMETLKPALETRGFDVSVFHATGMNTRVMEKAIGDGLFDVVLDLLVEFELIGYASGSLLGASPNRMEAAAEKGIPQIVVLRRPQGNGRCLWAPYKPIPSEFDNNKRFIHNDLNWVLSVNPEQNLEMVKFIIEKLNKSKGPATLIITKKPEINLSHTAGAGTYQDNPELMEAMLSLLKEGLNPKVRMVELDISTREKGFGNEVVRLLDEMMSNLRSTN